MKQNKCWWECGDIGTLCATGEKVTDSAAAENSAAIPQNPKTGHGMFQQFHFWVSTPKTGKQGLEGIFVHTCS